MINHGYIVGDGPMQLIEDHHNGIVDVYNFISSYDESHSHIQYNTIRKTKKVFRYLNNPDNSGHAFYPLELYASQCISVDSIYDFPFTYESLYKVWLNDLSKEQLIELHNYLMNEKENILLTKRR